MAITLRAQGTAATGTNPNPTYPGGGQSQDLNILTVVLLGQGSPPNAPNTPSGYTLRATTYCSGCALNRPAIWLFTRVGAFSGSLGALSYTGGNPTPIVAQAVINIWGCSAGETWDLSGLSSAFWGRGEDSSFGTTYSNSCNSGGVNGVGRLDPGPGDVIVVDTALAGATSASGFSPVFNSGSGQTVTLGANSFNTWVQGVE